MTRRAEVDVYDHERWSAFAYLWRQIARVWFARHGWRPRKFS